jgi:hypothetical protein
LTSRSEIYFFTSTNIFQIFFVDTASQLMLLWDYETPVRTAESKMAHDIDRLASKARGLDRALTELAGHKHGEQLSTIIRKPPHPPGWTTIAEFTLVETSLDYINAQIDTIGKHLQKVVEAAQQVGKE